MNSRLYAIASSMDRTNNYEINIKNILRAPSVLSFVTFCLISCPTPNYLVPRDCDLELAKALSQLSHVQAIIEDMRL